MKRREFIAGLGSAAAWPVVARAQQTERTARIGFFAPQAPNPPWIQAFRAGMYEHGYLEGHNLTILLRSAEGKKERYEQLMGELFAFRPDVLMTWSTPTSVALRQATSTVPIVSISGDPVGLGLAASLAHPSGNLTGFAILSGGVEAKQLQILKDAIPGLSRVAVLTNSTNVVNPPIVRSIEQAGSTVQIAIQVLEVQEAEELVTAFDTAMAQHSGAVLVLRDDLFDLQRRQIAALAAQRMIPTMGGWSEYVHAGCLFAYGVNLSDLFRRAGGYIDEILKGAAPGNLPSLSLKSSNLL
jgi:putative ABC transport system substrate-binding protein